MLSRSDGERRRDRALLGARPRAADLFDAARWSVLYEGADAVVNLASVSPSATPPPGRTPGATTTCCAPAPSPTWSPPPGPPACAGSSRRAPASSTPTRGDSWITEQDPIEITPATEPFAVGESHVQDYAGGLRVGVLLRFGHDHRRRPADPVLAQGRRQPVGRSAIGRPDQWSHLVHTDDLGSAVVAALHAPSGVYNVGAAPVPRGELVDGFAKAVGAAERRVHGPGAASPGRAPVSSR